ncbi:MAG: hypothetical protein QW650_01050 [Thermofilum sp.]
MKGRIAAAVLLLVLAWGCPEAWARCRGCWNVVSTTNISDLAKQLFQAAKKELISRSKALLYRKLALTFAPGSYLGLVLDMLPDALKVLQTGADLVQKISSAQLDPQKVADAAAKAALDAARKAAVSYAVQELSPDGSGADVARFLKECERVLVPLSRSLVGPAAGELAVQLSSAAQMISEVGAAVYSFGAVYDLAALNSGLSRTGIKDSEAVSMSVLKDALGFVDAVWGSALRGVVNGNDDDWIVGRDFVLESRRQIEALAHQYLCGGDLYCSAGSVVASAVEAAVRSTVHSVADGALRDVEKVLRGTLLKASSDLELKVDRLYGDFLRFLKGDRGYFDVQLAYRTVLKEVLAGRVSREYFTETEYEALSAVIGAGVRENAPCIRRFVMASEARKVASSIRRMLEAYDPGRIDSSTSDAAWKDFVRFYWMRNVLLLEQTKLSAVRSLSVRSGGLR